MLIVDTREYGPVKEKVLAGVPGADTQFLAAGDYLFFDQDGHSMGIERKEIRDLLNSIAGGKMKRQLNSLRQYDRGILLIEGFWVVKPDGSLYVHQKRTGWTPQSIQAILLALQEQTGAKVLHTSSLEETIITLRMFDKKAEAGCFWKKGKNE